MANREHFDVFAGEDRTLTLHARDSSNLAADLTGKTVTWRVGKPPNWPQQDKAIISYAGTVTDATNGVFTVPLAASDTAYLHGEYMHQATAVDGSGNTSFVSTGRLRIRREIMA